MRPPIIVNNRGDVGIFDSVERAERDLEPIDIRNGEYVIYDSEGRLVECVITTRFLNETVRLHPSPEGEVNPEALRQVVIDFLSRVNTTPAESLSPRPLEQLIADALRHKIK